MAHSALTPMLLEVLRLAASDGDVSAWGRTQEEEDVERDRQHFLTQFPVRDLIFGRTWLTAARESQVREVRTNCWDAPSVLSRCISMVPKLPMCQGEKALPKGLIPATPSDKAEAQLQESQSRAKIPLGFASTLACSSVAREKLVQS